MKTTDPRDPLDQKIDQLLASQAVKAPGDFAARTLARAEAESRGPASGKLAPVLRFALPLAAALALAFVIYSQFASEEADPHTQLAETPPAKLTPATNNIAHAGMDTAADDALTHYEIQELLMLQEGLSGFAKAEAEELSAGDLLDTLDTLYSI